MLEHNVYPGVIEWTQGGEAFVVKDIAAFVTRVTPRQFKHSNFASFVRQLNKYGFHKVRSFSTGMSSLSIATGQDW